MREMPLGGARIVHGLHDHVFRRQRCGEREGKIARLKKPLGKGSGLIRQALAGNIVRRCRRILSHSVYSRIRFAASVH